MGEGAGQNLSKDMKQRASLVVLTFCVILLIRLEFGSALRCLPHVDCKWQPTCCASGVMVIRGDICGQCDACARAELDPCQGMWGGRGQCTVGHKCVIQEANNNPLEHPLGDMGDGICLKGEVADAWKAYVDIHNKQPWSSHIAVSLVPGVKEGRTRRVPKCGQEKKNATYLVETEDK